LAVEAKENTQELDLMGQQASKFKAPNKAFKTKVQKMQTNLRVKLISYS
jgi:hypothetical protein